MLHLEFQANMWIYIILLIPTIAVTAKTACENEEMTLRCPGNDLIQLKMAIYGRNDDRLCISQDESENNVGCGLHTQTDIVRKMCDDKSECTFRVGPSTFPDPCPGTAKYLQVMWKCVAFAATCPGPVKQVTKGNATATAKNTNGAWARDPYQQTQKIFFMGWRPYDAPHLYEYATTEALEQDRATTFHRIPDRVDGTGFVVYDGSIYYNKERSRNIVRFDLREAQAKAEREIPNANYHNTSPYGVNMDTDIDLAVDENGLWVIYATERNNGNIVVSSLERESLNILNTWTTPYSKLSALNSFIVCGVLYVVNYDTLTIDYMFNTTSKVGKEINIAVPGITTAASSIDYNPKDQLLYVWESKTAINYNIEFASPSVETTTVAPTTTTTTIVAKPDAPLKTTKPNVKPSAPPGRTTTSFSTSTSTQQSKYCRSQEASGLIWKDTAYGTMAFLPCPGIGGGHANWMCAGNVSNPSWTTHEPDLTQCASRWIKDFIEKINVGTMSVGDLSSKLLEDLLQKQTELKSWDIAKVIEALIELLKVGETEPRNAATLTNTIIKCSSILLSQNVSAAWTALKQPLRTHLASSLMGVVEDAGFFLAKDIVMDKNNPSRTTPTTAEEFDVNWVEEQVSLGIHVQRQTVDDLPSTDVSWPSSRGDTVKLNIQAISEAINDKSRKTLVFLSFVNIGKYLEDSNGFGSRKKPVNSQVVSVSVASVTDDQFKRISHSLDLKRPLLLNLRHHEDHLPYHTCAFWKTSPSEQDGSWSRTGCRKLSGNRTHSLCECDHMTSFVVISSQQPITPSETAPIYPSDMPLKYLNIARSGVVISFVFLLVVAITLIAHSKSLDLNTIHKNTVISLCFTELVFLFGIHQVDSQTMCVVTAVLLHFGVLCVFTWSVLETLHLFMVLDDRIERNDRWRWYYVIGYTCPAVVVAVSCAVKYKGYGGFLVCWLKSDDGFVWSIIAPCCVAICMCIFFLFASLRKMKKFQLNRSGKSRNGRSHAARMGVLLLLLIVMWSCGLLWFSNLAPKYTAALFCIFCSAHGVVSFIFYCLIPTEVRQMYSKCISSRRKPADNRRFSGLDHSCDCTETNTVRSNLRMDGTTRTIYHYQSGNPVTSTTMVPIANAQSMRLAKAAAIMENEPFVMNPSSTTVASDLVVHRFNTCRERAGRNLSECECLIASADDTDPKLPSTISHPRHAVWNDYYPTQSSRQTLDHASINGVNIHQCATNQYEQPTEHYCQCTQISGTSSGCYDHLHDDPYNRSQKGTPAHRCHFPTPPPPTNRMLPNGTVQSGRAPHHYETMGPFLPVAGVNNTNQNPNALQQRHCYEDVTMHQVTVEGDQRRRPLSNCSYNDIRMQHMENNYRQSSASTDNLCNRKITQTGHYPIMYCPMPRFNTEPAECRRTDNHNRSGRHSDPLSTDQGYDTDSQQAAQQLATHRHSSDIPKPHYTSLVVTNSGKASSSPCSSQLTRPSSASAESDCASENDREVELIIGVTANRSGKPENAAHSSGAADKVTLDRELDDISLDGIDTATGGCVSGCGTVASWSAVPAHDPRVANTKFAAMNNVRRERSNSSHNDLTPSLDARSVDAEAKCTRSNDPCTYTLPGTAQAGTKARIDLRNGGISMITNL
uniref:Latrophilin-3 n=1 Tax=Phallusia mammillata TaxID=59560 RepID=A0A6F9DJW2_9ASCI|nr:latrophilin-3 [Phallusia mammillata]